MAQAVTPSADISRRSGFPLSIQAFGGVSSGLGVTLVALAAGLFVARRALDSRDATTMFAVAKAIVTTHTTMVSSADAPWPGDSPHSSYGLGQSLVEVPAYLLAVGTGHDPRSLAMLANPVLFAVVVLAIWAWGRAAGATARQAAGVALATGFGTLLLAYTPTGGSEIGTALGVAIAILGVEMAGRRQGPGSAVAGAGVGIAVLFRPDSALVVAIPVAIAVVLRTRRGFPLFLLATAPVAVLTLAYNGAHGAQYQGMTLSQAFSHPFVPGVYGLLLSPGRGLLLYVPLVLPVLAAIPWAWKRSPLITGLCLALLAVRVLFYAKWFAWQGGWAWGPRFLVPAMPCLAPLLLEIVRRFSRSHLPLTVAVTMVLALSVSVQVLGASVRYDTDSANLTMTALWSSNSDSTAQDRVLSDWKYFPILEHLREVRHGRNLARGYRGGAGLPFN